MKHYIAGICLFLSGFLPCHSQNGLYNVTAINEGIGNCAATLSNYGSIFNNVAGLAAINQINFAASYKLFPDTEWQNTVSASASYPTKWGTAGIGFVRVGDVLANQQLASIGFANQFGIASIGLKANLISYAIEGLGSKSVPLFDLGGIAELTPQLFIGAYITNIAQAKIADYNNERFPTLLVVGLSYRPSWNVMINAEIEQDIDYTPTFKAGLEYKPIKNISLRTGINTGPNKQYFGLGFAPTNVVLILDYALSHDVFWGFAHQISISYSLHSNKE